VREGTVEALLPELWLGNLDLVVGRLPDRRIAPALGEKALMQEGVALVTGCHHPLASRKRVSWEHLTDFPWVWPPVNTLLRGPLERAFERNGVPLPANRIETLSVHVIRTYLHHTDAIAALAADVSRYYESERMLAVLPIELPGLVRPVGVMWSRQRPLSPAAQALIESLEATVERLTPSPVSRKT
jgi:DNA-binding transcriptional LysR family regulator